MLKKELEELRNRLNEMIASGQVEYDEILKISQQLDELLIKYMKEIDPCTGDKIKENGSQDPACNILLDIPEKYIFFFMIKTGGSWSFRNPTLSLFAYITYFYSRS